jgi:hypothetical protein
MWFLPFENLTVFDRHLGATISSQGFDIETQSRRALSPSQASTNTSYVAFTGREPSLDFPKSKALMGVVSTTKVGLSFRVQAPSARRINAGVGALPDRAAPWRPLCGEWVGVVFFLNRFLVRIWHSEGQAVMGSPFEACHWTRV